MRNKQYLLVHFGGLLQRVGAFISKKEMTLTESCVAVGILQSQRPVSGVRLSRGRSVRIQT
jgi:hypothetical protein